MLPYRDGVPLKPTVTPDDKLTRAIELMVVYNLKCIAVVRGRRPIGRVCFEDALEKLGL